jgi:hypothetical protein
VRALKALGVERYESYLADGRSEYFGRGDSGRVLVFQGRVFACSSRMTGNLQVRFLEGWAPAMAPGYSTLGITSRLPVTRPRKCREPSFDRRARPRPGGADQRVLTVWDRSYGKRTLAITLEQLRSYAWAATVVGRVN